MFTFRWQYICGASWVVASGTVMADGIDDARTQIEARNSLEDLHAADWIEKTVGGLTRFVLEIPDPRGDVSRERVEFYQEPSLFNLRKETSDA